MVLASVLAQRIWNLCGKNRMQTKIERSKMMMDAAVASVPLFYFGAEQYYADAGPM